MHASWDFFRADIEWATVGCSECDDCATLYCEEVAYGGFRAFYDDCFIAVPKVTGIVIGELRREGKRIGNELIGVRIVDRSGGYLNEVGKF